ncbi:MAG: NUDIX hydrolase [Candidatus Aenigmatarchaeota archaeon]
MVERLSVGAFVRNKEGKYLLLKTQAKVGKIIEKYWDIPKGGVEREENLKEALKRELKEELGIDKFYKIKKLNISFSFNFPIEIRNRTGFDSQKVELFFVEFYGKNEDIKVDGKEIIDFVFVNENEFFKKASYETTKKAFRKFLKSTKSLMQKLQYRH